MYRVHMAVAATANFDVRAGSLFDLDPELAEQLDPGHLIDARARAIVPVADLAAGEWGVAELARATARPFALMVLDGILLRELLMAGSTASELLGPGDIVNINETDDALLRAEARWSVPEAARIAVLDDRLLPILRAWPSVGRILLTRAVLAFFGHLAERWGRVSPSGVIVPLQLTHEMLGRLIGARRPTVSLALKELGAERLLERRRDGAWLLPYEAFTKLGAEDAIPAGWHPADARHVAVQDADEGDAAPTTAKTISADEVVALRARVGALREDHASRVLWTATVLAHSRARREATLGLTGRPTPE
jgi:DNA-binding transcriptional ArsR family regulator